MGIASSQFRLIMLTMQKTDLEFKMQLVSQTRMGLANRVNDLLNVGTDLDPDEPEFKMLEARKQRLQLVDKKLEAQMERYKAKLSMVDTELDSVRQLLDKNIKSSFNYGMR